ncbi:MAG: ABC transporter ATP-binding protein [Defluviitaleaceae bacterium]|nr:ABC transporter ATP-binding protein [Defluviitaleaceae bacterium]
MSTILEVKGLNKQYKNSSFRLNDVSMSIPSGAIMGFVGENGAGKSTTIGCILNTLIKDSGTVTIFGREMTNDSTDIRDDIGVVYDTNCFPAYLTPTQIASAMRHMFSKWDDNLYLDYLKKFKLPEKQSIKAYSRGMSMKLNIAVALAHKPRLLVLDEATSGLDPIMRDEILDVFLDFVTDENKSILLSSHITSDLEKVADYITFIHDGSIVFTESKDDLIYKYGVMRCKAAQFEQLDKADILAFRKHDYQIDALINDRKTAEQKYRDIVIDNITIEEIMLMLVKGERANDNQ